MLQPLDKTPSLPPPTASGLSPEWAEEYLKKHPQLYPAFRDITLRLLASGRRRISAKAIVEIIRAENDLQYRGRFKIDNRITPALARRFIEEFPNLARCFQLRRSKLAGGEDAAD